MKQIKLLVVSQIKRRIFNRYTIIGLILLYIYIFHSLELHKFVYWIFIDIGKPMVEWLFFTAGKQLVKKLVNSDKLIDAIILAIVGLFTWVKRRD